MFFMKLDCGRDVMLDSFDYSRTYAGLLEGLPNSEMNGRIIERALVYRDSTWGKRKVHLIQPTLNLTDPAHPALPPVLMRAWLVCFNPVDPAFMGSELVVDWFTAECHTEAIADVVFRAVRGLPWEQLARDFDW
jgi:hypothetical protein